MSVRSSNFSYSKLKMVISTIFSVYIYILKHLKNIFRVKFFNCIFITAWEDVIYSSNVNFVIWISSEFTHYFYFFKASFNNHSDLLKNRCCAEILQTFTVWRPHFIITTSNYWKCNQLWLIHQIFNFSVNLRIMEFVQWLFGINQSNQSSSRYIACS